MQKIYITSDNKNLKEELISFFSVNFEIYNEISEKTDIVIEGIIYDKDSKFKSLKDIEKKIRKDTVIVSNSVCIKLLEQAAHLQFPERLTGAGFYSTFSAMKGIELTKTSFTNTIAMKTTEEIIGKSEKEFFLVQDRPGMINMRIISLIINEAYSVLQEGTSNRADIDTAMKLGTNYPYGPIEWSEKLGIDVIYHIVQSMFEEFGEDRYRVTPLLRDKYLEEIVRKK